MWIPLITLITGLAIGTIFSLEFSVVSTNLLLIVALCLVDSILFGFKANLRKEFNTLLFTNEFILNSILAIGLVYLGNIMNTNLFIAVAIILIAKIFCNLSNINNLIFLKK